MNNVECGTCNGSGRIYKPTRANVHFLPPGDREVSECSEPHVVLQVGSLEVAPYMDRLFADPDKIMWLCTVSDKIYEWHPDGLVYCGDVGAQCGWVARPTRTWHEAVKAEV